MTDRRTESYADLWSGIASAGQRYLDAGVVAGDRVLLILPNRHEFLHCHFGALKIGAISVPLRSDYTWWEVRRIAANCAPRLVVSTAKWLEKNLSRLGLGEGTETLSLEEFYSSASRGDDMIAKVGGRAIASIHYSYFGEGYPKGAMLTHANYIYAAIGYTKHQGFRQSDRLLIVLPMSHVYALSGCVNAGLIRGAALVLSTLPTPGSMLRSIQRHRISVLTAVPVMFQALTTYDRRGQSDLSSLRLLVTGGAYMPAEEQRSFEEALGAQMVQGYGLTECFPVICNPPGPGNRRGTLGIPGRRDIAVRIWGGEGRPLPAGAVGEIQILSPTTMAGYYRPPRGSVEPFEGAWLRTGDLGALDEEGHLHFHGMMKPILNVYGNKVDLIEVREAMLEHPSLAEVELSVEQTTDQNRLGEVRINAAVTPRPGATVTSSELRTFCVDRLAGYKIPRVITVVGTGGGG